MLFNTDLDRPAEAILEDLRSAAQQNTATTDLKIGIIVVPLATLLVKLSQEAHQTADSVRRFTKWLLGLTIALFFLTLALLLMQTYQVYEEYSFDQEHHQSSASAQSK